MGRKGGGGRKWGTLPFGYSGGSVMHARTIVHPSRSNASSCFPLILKKENEAFIHAPRLRCSLQLPSNLFGRGYHGNEKTQIAGWGLVDRIIQIVSVRGSLYYNPNPNPNPIWLVLSNFAYWLFLYLSLAHPQIPKRILKNYENWTNEVFRRKRGVQKKADKRTRS